MLFYSPIFSIALFQLWLVAGPAVRNFIKRLMFFLLTLCKILFVCLPNAISATILQQVRREMREICAAWFSAGLFIVGLNTAKWFSSIFQEETIDKRSYLKGNSCPLSLCCKVIPSSINVSRVIFEKEINWQFFPSPLTWRKKTSFWLWWRWSNSWLCQWFWYFL